MTACKHGIAIRRYGGLTASRRPRILHWPVKFQTQGPEGPIARTPRPTSARAARQRRQSGPDSLGDVAYAGIRRRIVSLELPPGSAVNEAALATELGVGLAPVRSALRRLAWENLVVILPRRGTARRRARRRRPAGDLRAAGRARGARGTAGRRARRAGGA